MPIVVGPDQQGTEISHIDGIGDTVLDWDNGNVWDGEQTWDGYFGSGIFTDQQGIEISMTDHGQTALLWNNTELWNATQTWRGLKTE